MGYRTVRLFRPLGNTSLSCQGSLHALRPFLHAASFEPRLFDNLTFGVKANDPDAPLVCGISSEAAGR